MTLSRVSAFLSLICINYSSSAQTPASKPYYSDPAISPNGQEIAFVSGGDIWTVPSSGGEARLLVSNPATESRPVYSPDGRFIAFNSTRSGNGDLYVMNIISSEIMRLTYDDAPEEISAWSSDGYIYYSSASKDIAGYRDIFRIKATGGSAMLISDTRYVSEYQGVPSPDGKTIALVAHGIGSSQWWRNGSSHLDESEIWLLKPGQSPKYQRLSSFGAKELWPMWNSSGDAIYYISDRNGHQNLWMQPLKGVAKQLTNFTEGRVLWPSISSNGKSIVFERNFSIWSFDIARGEAKTVSIEKRGVASGQSIEHSRMTGGFEDLSLSPDGKKVAFIAHGEVFVASAKDGGEAARITFTNARESYLKWAPNSNTLVYISGRSGINHAYQYNFITAKESQLTDGKGDDAAPIFSPDGKMLAFIHNGKELRVLDMATRNESLIAKGFLGREPFTSSGTVCWSPDGKWLAFAAFGNKALRNIYVVPVNGGEAKPVSFLANSFGGAVQWNQDGKSIFFVTGQRTENNNIARVDLIPQQPRFREDQFRDLFVDPIVPKLTPIQKKETPADSLLKNIPSKQKDPILINWEGIKRRLSFLPLGVSVEDISISKDGNTLILITSIAGQQNLYTYSLDELSKEPAVLKQLTTSPGNKSAMQLSADSKDVWYLENGRIQSVSLDSRQSKSLNVTAEMDIDFNKEKLEVFKEAWEVQDRGFYDPGFHGANWEVVKETYAPYAAGAQTPDELRRIISLMIGELNASHSGIGGPISTVVSTGRIGVRLDQPMYESTGKLKITEVIAMSPASLAGMKVGDYINAIDGLTLDASVNIDQLLENKVNRRVVFSITGNYGEGLHDVVVRPVSQATEKGLVYKQWVNDQREYVSKQSHGRLGYVHMIDMSQQSLDQLYLDMDAENHSREGVVVDIRNNNGGFVNAYALDVLARKGYMTMTVRGLPPSPARVSLGQRALDAPTILLTNQHSLSDAEDFSEGYRTLGLGKVVGEPTAGWIIYTTSVQLIDGSVIRLPTIKITDHAGKDMELSPRPVDIQISNPLGEMGDLQIDAAVKELLKEIDSGKR